MSGRDDERAPDDGVGRLIRLTAEEPRVPATAFEAAKAAAREHWRAELQRRARRRNLTWIGLAAAAVLVIGIALRLFGEREGVEPRIVARLETLRGSGRTSVGDAVTTLTGGAELTAGTRLEVGAEGGAALRMDGGASLRIDGGTHVALESATAVLLERGAVYVDSAVPTGRVDVLTPFGRVREIGTQFEVRVSEDSLRVRVREGRVALDAEQVLEPVPAGMELTLGAAGVERESIGRHGSAWAWVEALAPTPPIEGLSAGRFLEWAARELGLELSYSSDEARLRAEQAVLHGSIEGLTPEEAIQAVLPTAGLAHRVEGERLRVRQALDP
jgi:hypothetical protein